jgi:hypothetical protein
VHIPDPQRLGVLLGAGLAEKCGGEVDTGHLGAEPGHLPCDPAVTAREVEDPPAPRRPGQAEQRGQDRIMRVGEAGVVEVGHCVVPGATHAQHPNGPADFRR